MSGEMPDTILNVVERCDALRAEVVKIYRECDRLTATIAQQQKQLDKYAEMDAENIRQCKAYEADLRKLAKAVIAMYDKVGLELGMNLTTVPEYAIARKVIEDSL